MFDNVGGKIKALAAVLGWIDFIAGFIIAFAVLGGGERVLDGDDPAANRGRSVCGVVAAVRLRSARRGCFRAAAARGAWRGEKLRSAETFGDLPEL